MKISAAAAAFIFVRSATAENVSGTRKLSDDAYTVQAATYAGQSVIGCATDGISSEALNSLNSDHDVMKTGKGFIDIRVKSDDERAEVEATVGSPCKFLYDLEDAIKSFEDELVTSRQGEDWFSAYHTYDEIHKWYRDLNSDYPDLTTYVNSIGETYEGRDIMAFHVTAPNTSPNNNKRKIWIQCQLHAREWVSAPTCMYIVHSLVTLYEKEKDQKDQPTRYLLQHAELIVIPIANPDGYAHTWISSRLWRKNRSKPIGGCYGVDLNRNYDDHWNTGIGTSTRPCSEIYKGTSPGSEPEIRATTDYFQQNAPIYGAIDIHAYSQLILSPLGWTNTRSPDHNTFVNLMDKMETVIEGVHGTQYTSQPAVDLYPTSATSVDWFYGEGLSNTNGGVRAYALAFELRDKGANGFELPADQIRPNCEEILPSIYIFMNTAIDSPLVYFNKCVDTDLTFKRRPMAQKGKSCAWVAKSQKNISKFCATDKKKYFEDFGRRQYIWKKCCLTCRT